jgi:DnaA-homolog protein
MDQIALDIAVQPRQTFETLFAGLNGDALAHLRVQANCSLPSPVPTYIWGGQGCGKTHCLKAIQYNVNAVQPAGVDAVGWMDADVHEAQPFSAAWRVLLLDDVDRFDSAQQHLAFNWFINALTPESGPPRWIVCSGSAPPRQLPIRDDLRTRLGWGDMFELQPLSEPQCAEVLQFKARARGLLLSADVIAFVLARFSRNLGALDELLSEIDRFSLAHQRPVTIPLIKTMMDTL